MFKGLVFADSAATRLVTSISKYEMRQRLKKAAYFGIAQTRLGEQTAIHRRARQTVMRDVKTQEVLLWS